MFALGWSWAKSVLLVEDEVVASFVKPKVQYLALRRVPYQAPVS